MKIWCSTFAGIRVQLPPESVFNLTGMPVHHEPEQVFNLIGIGNGEPRSQSKIKYMTSNDVFLYDMALQDLTHFRVVKWYDPAGSNSKERYAWIAKHLENAVEEAIRIRNAN